MLKIWGSGKLEGGFEMNSKHDILSTVVTVAYMLLVFVLVMLGKATGEITTPLLSGMGLVLGYWFTRSGVVTGASSQSTNSPTVDAISQVVQNVVSTEVNKLSQAPAQNANSVPGNNSNQI